MTDVWITQIALIVTSIVTLITLVITQVLSTNREARNRRWDQEDRERAREQMKREANDHTQTTVAKIDENTEISRSAFHEANGAKELLSKQQAQWQAKFDLLTTLVQETQVRMQHMTRRGDVPQRRSEDQSDSSPSHRT